MINPVNHAAEPAGAALYRVEPYVVAADVYGVAPHVGRGGWTWYTGSAGWMYRLLSESLLGVHRHGERLRIVPCVPASWAGYRMELRYGAALYRIEVECIDTGEALLTLDGVPQERMEVVLQRAEAVHEIALRWPRDAPAIPE